MDPQQRSALTQQIMDRVFVRLEASGRHVHLTREQALTLFGHDLTPDRPLSQPGQFLAKERVALIGPKGKFSNVAVLGPARSAAQAEISLTDSKILGITPPIRQSGDITGSPGFILTGDLGTVAIQEGVIVAKRHLHLTPESAHRFGVADGQLVSLQTYTTRPLTFADVVVRVSPDFADRAHLDYDEANACGLGKDDYGRILP